MEVEILGDEKTGFRMKLIVPLDTNMIKPVQGKKFEPDFKLGDMRPSSSGKYLFLYNGKVTGIARHPITGENLTIPLRIEMPTPKDKGIRKKYMAYREQNKVKGED